MDTLETILEQELQDAVSALEIGEGDEQEAMFEMIRGLQIRAFKRGIEMADADRDEIVVGFDAEEATSMVTDLLRSGSVAIRLTVNN